MALSNELVTFGARTDCGFSPYRRIPNMGDDDAFDRLKATEEGPDPICLVLFRREFEDDPGFGFVQLPGEGINENSLLIEREKDSRKQSFLRCGGDFKTPGHSGPSMEKT